MSRDGPGESSSIDSTGVCLDSREVAFTLPLGAITERQVDGDGKGADTPISDLFSPSLLAKAETWIQVASVNLKEAKKKIVSMCCSRALHVG